MTVHERRPVSIRHITKADAGAPGAVDVVTASFIAQPIEGVNGPAGWVSGEFELRLLEEGRFALSFPNDSGGDGVLHRDRFLCITDPHYAAGDEWIEIYEGEQPGLGEPLIVGTPDVPTLNAGQVTLKGFDVLELYKTVRETGAGFWVHAPRDVFEHYTRVWRFVTAENFATAAPAGWTLFKTAVDTDTGTAHLDADDFPGPSVKGPDGITVGTDSPDPWMPWRVDFELSRLKSITTGQIFAGLINGANNNWQIQAALTASGQLTVALPLNATSFPTYEYTTTKLVTEKAGPLTIAFEGRDRWVFVYVNGQLATIVRMPISVGASYPRLEQLPGSPGNAEYSDLTSIVVRCAPRFGLRGGDLGDYRLPGAPQPGGLIGSYFDDRDLSSLAAGDYAHRVLAPARVPVHRRLDPVINFAPADPPAWRPVGVEDDRWSVRWTGSIYLDLAGGDRHIRVADLDDGARVWIGKTRGGEQLVDDFVGGAARTTAASVGLRTHLATSESGWYPIVVEYFQGVGPGGLRLQDKAVSAGAGAWAAVPAARLSPQGIYEAEVRGDSHYEQLQEMGRTFGLQFRAVGRALQSGHFPGELVPRVRVGRDTSRIIDETNGAERERTLNTRDTIQVLIIDAAGLAKEGAQLQREQIDFAQVGQHLIAHTDQISLAEIAVPQVLARRAQTMQELRSVALEELGIRAEDSKELIDSWPLTGDVALFDFEPGDGVLCRLADLAVADRVARRLTAVVRPLRPLALGPPAVSFRPRPRSARSQLRALARQQAASTRNYQGQLAERVGSVGAIGTSAGSDTYSRVPAPDVANIVTAELVVQAKSDSSVWTIEVNDVATSVTFSRPGRYDVSAYAGSNGFRTRMTARATGGTGTIEYALVLTVHL